MSRSYQAIICGAGIAGVSAAYFLSKAGFRDLLLVDERPPLSLTSDRSTECYRNWWPDPHMLALMNRSIDLMEQLALESRNAFHLNRRGYLYLTGDEARVPDLTKDAQRIAEMGAGELRVHTSGDSCYEPAGADGYVSQPSGADLLIGPDLIQRYYPYVTPGAMAGLHARRAGWLSAQQLGMVLFEQARARGVHFSMDRVEGVEVVGGRVRGVRMGSTEQYGTSIFIDAAGPQLAPVGRLAGADLPVHTELHLKVVIRDALGVVGREAPLLIWQDAQTLPWESEEHQALAEDPATRWLTQPFPPGAHTRPEGAGESRNIILLWEYRTQRMEPRWPPPLDDMYPEIALRGLSTMLPRLQAYFGHMPKPQIDGGYYTKTEENRPLIGPAGPEGAYVIGALSGYGIMAACGAGDLLAAHIAGSPLPRYAPSFLLSRYDNPSYLESLKALDRSGQL
jgi:glycine/D-amino acid oxidase-like deaminating enzyme